MPPLLMLVLLEAARLFFSTARPSELIRGAQITAGRPPLAYRWATHVNLRPFSGRVGAGIGMLGSMYVWAKLRDVVMGMTPPCLVVAWHFPPPCAIDSRCLKHTIKKKKVAARVLVCHLTRPPTHRAFPLLLPYSLPLPPSPQQFLTRGGAAG